MKRISSMLGSSATVLLMSLSMAMAQTAGDEAQRQADQILRELEQERRQIEQDVRSREQVLGSQEQGGPAAPSQRDPSAPCLQIDRIDFVAGTIVSESELQAVFARFEGECLQPNVELARDLPAAIADIYKEKNAIGTIRFDRQPPYNRETKVLRLSVVEARVNGFIVNDADAIGTGEIVTAFPGMGGELFDVRDFNQGLEQINRLPSNQAVGRFFFQEPDSPDAGFVKLDLKTDDRVGGSFTIDNLGQSSTGDYRTQLSVRVDNPLGLNDGWNFVYRRSHEDHPFDFGDTQPSSNLYYADVSVPYGYWTLFADGYFSDYKSSVDGLFGPLETSGSSAAINLRANRVIYRDRFGKTSIDGKLSWKRTDNFLQGTRLQTGSRALSVARLALSHQFRCEREGTPFTAPCGSVELGYERGLDLFGAFDDSTAPAGSPKGQFNKVTLAANYGTSFDVLGELLRYNTSLFAQWSPVLLFGSEQISLGGQGTVRGTRDSVLFGNTGGYWRNDITLGGWTVDLFEDLPLRIVPSFGADVGFVAADQASTISDEAIVGVHGSLQLSLGKVQASAFLSNLLIGPETTRSKQPFWGLSLIAGF